MILYKEYFKKEFLKKLMSMFSEKLEDASPLHKYLALSSLVKEYTAETWYKSNKKYEEKKEKQVYYFSMEFLIGRLLGTNLLNLGIYHECKCALSELNITLEELEEAEADAGLGNGGLGRLAACFLDSLASLQIPGHGCGIRYRYGHFEQKIIDGYQVELPDNWLHEGNLWESRREDKAVKVKFGGNIRITQENGRLTFIPENYETVLAVPYDTPIIGYKNNTVNTLRLWSAETSDSGFDFRTFSHGEFLKSLEHKISIECISQILYPNDSTLEGKKLRLKQQYFFVSAGLQSIIRSFKKNGNSIKKLDEHVAIQINDTHPAVAVAELMRILIDEEILSWDEAFRITVNTMAYTNHSIMAEALEKWPVDMFKSLLPRVYMIIEEINRRFCSELSSKYPGNSDKINSMSIIKDNYINMSYLAIVGSHSVNGVAKLHTEILKKNLFPCFYKLYPNKFNSKTNGISHRRWLLHSNPRLSALILDALGEKWITNPLSLKGLMSFSKDAAFRKKIAEVKRENKLEFVKIMKEARGIDIDPDSVFDVQVKRLHGYKRQLLNLFRIIDLYNTLKDNPNLEVVPRTFFFGAKASPNYYFAKEVIKLINSTASKINNDNAANRKIKIVFLENYGVSAAEKIIPASDVSEQISTASKEASGTGNMKFMMNGALTVATLDGANIEIREQVGEDNIITFGLTSEEVLNYSKYGGYSAYETYKNDLRINRIISELTGGFFNTRSSEFKNIYDSLLAYNDEYFVLKDFDSYLKAQEKVDTLYKDKVKWQQICINNIANSGIFSSDYTILDYSKNIWGTKIIK